MTKYLYTYAAHEDEQALCQLELRTLFRGAKMGARSLISARRIEPSRSPFIHERLAIEYMTPTLDELVQQVASVQIPEGQTFKVVYYKSGEDVSYEEERVIERSLGAMIRGKADMRNPELLFGVTKHAEGFIFGTCAQSSAIWKHHMDKPQNYSTALSTRLARAVVNIAVPDIEGVRVIDPCCGIGTVLLEALSMGIDIIGRDINPLTTRGARLNLAHFGYPDVVTLGDMREITESYDTAIIDLPYNLCSKLSAEERLSMLRGAHRFADRVILITTEPIDESVAQAGFEIIDRIQVHKGRFVREVLVVQG
ncbi:TRM11 family SAM-dependent methyltransferase [Paenibacillus guangzhouensis]|uniref:TRM11 family SAM-dependent methyltransferase n=1 Tax=Paenibacillus guangzhouensis TaxID=1473112 RepID=UPI0012677F37|nr:RNA methyltransferase [Paenibacillus guangzhouensis]